MTGIDYRPQTGNEMLRCDVSHLDGISWKKEHQLLLNPLSLFLFHPFLLVANLETKKIQRPLLFILYPFYLLGYVKGKEIEYNTHVLQN